MAEAILLLKYFQILLIILGASSTFKMIHVARAAEKFPVAKPRCKDTCGNNVTIPYPFGIGGECFLDEWYEIVCQSSNNSVNNANLLVPKLKKVWLEVLEISLPNYHPVLNWGTMRVNLPITYNHDDSNSSCGSAGAHQPERRGEYSTTTNFTGSLFYYASLINAFLAVGCGNFAVLTNTADGMNTSVGCQSDCSADPNVSRGYTNNTYCCYNTVPSYFQSFSISFIQRVNIGARGAAAYDSCSYAALVYQDNWSNLNMPEVDLESMRMTGHAPAGLIWGIPDTSVTRYDNLRESKSAALDCNSGTCYCRSGFHGNPYLVDGCQDINECEDPGIALVCGDRSKCVNNRERYSCVDSKRTIKLVSISIGSVIGALLILLLGRWLYRTIKRRQQLKLKQKFFEQNGGLLLQQQLSSPEGNVESGKLFDSNELEKATDNFNEDRVLGKGGQGTVYKGMLTDGRIVAIKKSKGLDEGSVDQFINEVLILSQINHRNVVKLLGCCLETEIPLLVYEFIPNGTLYQYLHNLDEDSPIPWNVRLRLAIEVAGAIAYLHSAASIPIFHRDIKTSNILLDEKYRVKVADFGTSRSVALDQTHVTTLVQGTFGYLDPEYFQSSQFTDKSDVYSFGVVLVELLTGQKPISSLRENEGRSLATYFIISMEENHLFDILDSQVLNQGKREDILVVANLARRCLHLNGRRRPTMKEVATELEGVVKKPHSDVQKDSNRETEKIEAVEADAAFRLKGVNVDDDMPSRWDTCPLLFTDSW